MIRDGNTTTCELYIYWVGNILISGWSFDKISIVDKNSPYEYSYVSGSWLNCEAKTNGSRYVSDVWIPTDVSQVRVKAENLSGYCPTTDSMTSTFKNTYQQVTIN